MGSFRKSNGNGCRYSRTIYIPLFIKEYVDSKNGNRSEYIRNLLKDYYRVLIKHCLGKDNKNIRFSFGCSEEGQQFLESMVENSPHVSVSELLRFALWLDYLGSKLPRDPETKEFLAENIIRVPVDDGFVDYVKIGEG